MYMDTVRLLGLSFISYAMGALEFINAWEIFVEIICMALTSSDTFPLWSSTKITWLKLAFSRRHMVLWKLPSKSSRPSSAETINLYPLIPFWYNTESTNLAGRYPALITNVFPAYLANSKTSNISGLTCRVWRSSFNSSSMKVFRGGSSSL